MINKENILSITENDLNNIKFSECKIDFINNIIEGIKNTNCESTKDLLCKKLELAFGIF